MSVPETKREKIFELFKKEIEKYFSSSDDEYEMIIDLTNLFCDIIIEYEKELQKVLKLKQDS